MNEISSEIGRIVLFYARRKIPIERIVGKGVMGKRLQEILKQTIVIAPENLGNTHGCPFNGKIYEEEFKFKK